MDHKPGCLEVCCFLCHAAKTGFLHEQFPHPGDDGELRAHDETVGLWVPQLARDKRGREAKHVMQYRPADGNTGLKYHVWRYHRQEYAKVRPPPHSVNGQWTCESDLAKC